MKINNDLLLQIEVAIKCLSRDRLENGTQEFLKEAGLMQTVDHDNIVRMYGVVLDKDNSLMLVGTFNRFAPPITNLQRKILGEIL